MGRIHRMHGMRDAVRALLFMVIFYCLSLKAKAADYSEVRDLLVSYSNTQKIEARVTMAVNIVKIIREQGLENKLSQFSKSEQEVISNANQLLIWIVGETRKFEKTLPLAEKQKLAVGIEDSLVPYGLIAVPQVSRQCRPEDISILSDRVTQPQNFSVILENLYTMVQLDRTLNRSHYYQKLARMVEKYPPFAYKEAILNYLNSYVLAVYGQGESLDKLKRDQELVKKRSDAELALRKLGVFYPKQLLAQYFQLAPNCF